MQFGPGLLFLVEDDLSVGVYLDDAYIGGFKLDKLDQFLRLRKLLDGPDFVAVLTSLEAREARMTAWDDQDAAVRSTG